MAEWAVNMNRAKRLEDGCGLLLGVIEGGAADRTAHALEIRQ
jgi:hypothetical protein